MTYEATHKQCTDCESSKGLTVNLDGSTKCFHAVSIQGLLRAQRALPTYALT